MPKYPNVVVKLVGEDGNIFSIIGRVIKALRRANVPQDEIDTFVNLMKSGTYDDALRTVVEWVKVR